MIKFLKDLGLEVEVNSGKIRGLLKRNNGDNLTLSIDTEYKVTVFINGVRVYRGAFVEEEFFKNVIQSVC